MKIPLAKRRLFIRKLSLTAGTTLHQIFNRNTVKISYSCMPNLKKLMATTNPLYGKQTPYHLKLATAVNHLIALWRQLLKISRDLPSHSSNGGQRASRDLCRPYWELCWDTGTISLLSETQTRDSVQNSVSPSGTTLRTESPSIFLDRSGKRKRLCRHLNRLICRSSSFLDESETSFILDKPVLSVHARIFWSFADSFCAHAPWQDK